MEEVGGFVGLLVFGLFGILILCLCSIPISILLGHSWDWFALNYIVVYLLHALLLPLVFFVGITSAWNPKPQPFPSEAVINGVLGLLLFFLSIGVAFGFFMSIMKLEEKLKKKEFLEERDGMPNES